MPPALSVGQRQFNGFTYGIGCDLDVVSEQGLDDGGPSREYDIPVAGGGNYLGRLEADKRTIIVALLPRVGLSEAAMATLRANALTAFARGADQPLYFRNPGEVVRYVNAHVKQGPDWVWNAESIAGLVLPVAVTLVASDPTVRTA